jgi:hypothetical protein
MIPPMSMDMFLLVPGELSDDAARGAIDATCGRLPGVSFAAWDGGGFGGVVSFWGAGLVSIIADDVSEQLPEELQQERDRALVISGKWRAWEFVVCIAEHLAIELEAMLYDPQQVEEHEFEEPTYALEDLRALFDEMQGRTGRWAP